MSETLRLGTRGSQLALWQANTVKARIEAAGGPACTIIIIKTTGDRLQEAPLSEIGGKRLFVKEIEDALLRHEIDLAVHSSKDMPAVLPHGLVVAGVLPREDPRDVVVLPVRLKPDTTSDTVTRDTTASDATRDAYVVSGFSHTIDSVEDLIAVLGQSPTIGTSSVRRIAQLTRLIPNARFAPIRGNLDTRLRKLDDGGYDALVLAAAGLRRLGFEHRISFALPAAACIPSPGQGIVAIEVRADDEVTRRAVVRINDAGTAVALIAERALVVALGGGCQTPIGALATTNAGGLLELSATVVSLDGSVAIRGRAMAAPEEAAALGARVGEQLLSEGAGDILAEAEHHRTARED